MDPRIQKRGGKETTETRYEILRLLKIHGALDAEGLARKLGITAVAVRQHLASLAADGYVDDEEIVSGRGRPLKRWSLTDGSLGFFPDSHIELLGELLVSIPKTFGKVGMERLLEERTQLQVRAYSSRLSDSRTLKERLEKLVEIRSAEGYMAQLEPDPEGDGWLLIQNHCSICAAAKECESLCVQEHELFSKVLGPRVTILRQEHLLSGGRRCIYHIFEQKSESPARVQDMEEDELMRNFAELERRYRAFMGDLDSRDEELD